MALVAGSWLLIANLRRRGFNLLTAGESNEMGQLSLSVNQLAKATAGQLKKHPDVTGIETSTRIDRGRHVVSITVHASPEVRMRSLLNAIEEADEDFRGATPSLDVTSRYLLRPNPVTSG